jgi:hypothetical protein
LYNKCGNMHGATLKIKDMNINIYFRNWKSKRNGFSISENGTVSLRRLNFFPKFLCRRSLEHDLCLSDHFVALAVTSSVWLLKCVRRKLQEYKVRLYNIPYGHSCQNTVTPATCDFACCVVSYNPGPQWRGHTICV